MIYLIKEETTVFMMGRDTRTIIKGYYNCDNENDVENFCKKKTEEFKGTYDEDRMDKTFYYELLNELK